MSVPNAPAKPRQPSKVDERAVHKLRRWGGAGSVLLALLAAAWLLLIPSLRADLDTLDFLKGGHPVYDREVQMNHYRLVLYARASLVLGSAIALCWLLWQYRAHALLRAMGVPFLRFHPVFACAAWFLPPANLLLPPLAMRELWRASDDSAPGARWRDGRTTPVLWAWWATFLGGLAIVAAAFSDLRLMDDPVHRMERNRTLMWACPVGAACAILAIVLIQRVSIRLDYKAHLALHGPQPDWRDTGVAAGQATSRASNS